MTHPRRLAFGEGGADFVISAFMAALGTSKESCFEGWLFSVPFSAACDISTIVLNFRKPSLPFDWARLRILRGHHFVVPAFN